jgi:hypothetical protein
MPVESASLVKGLEAVTVCCEKNSLTKTIEKIAKVIFFMVFNTHVVDDLVQKVFSLIGEKLLGIVAFSEFVNLFKQLFN